MTTANLKFRHLRENVNRMTDVGLWRLVPINNYELDVTHLMFGDAQVEPKALSSGL